MRYLSIALLSLTVLTGACRNKDLIRPGDPLNVAYDKSLALYEAGKYDDAAYGFDLVTRMGRGTNFSKDAQFYLAESYYNDNQYILAASEYQRFISYYPRDEKRQEVEYKLAMCYYQQSPRYRLDQTPTRRAIELFQLFNTKYPDSELVVESAERIDELRNKLARKAYEAGEFYLRTDRYLASTIYFDQVIDQYPESIWAERALLKQIETYIVYADNSIESKQAERYNNAISNYEKYLQLFPQSNNRAEAEALYLEAVDKLADIDPTATGDSIGSN
ncbi:MAG: outer membrane protein assembly factor BamD [bacterium]|nr:outer membrane protein assembly factor BamD [bacterium]